ncbi:MAG TPA: KpsF/GutQ family sugar-phosphate isomerase, partial [Sulfitobacter sp.]|nr:KpsF/GutQ family sugar-phosphate isomerase [Sulfitobacter sp.]
MTTPFLDTARRVIRTEAQALEQLADSLDDRFRQAIDLLVATRGRVIVT